jgi:DNA-binding MarR family transcriptional regulator
MPRTTSQPAAIAHELRTVLAGLVRRLRAMGELPLNQATVLGRLDRDGPQTTSALAGAERVRPQSMAQTVADLEQAALVTRQADPSDRRQFLLHLTEQGRSALAAERDVRDSWLAQAIDETLDAGDQATLARAIEILRRFT